MAINNLATSVITYITLYTYVNVSLELIQKMEWPCQGVENSHLIDSPQSPSKWLDHDLRAAISLYYCHYFILRNLYLKDGNNMSFAFLQLIVRLNSFYIFISINYFFRIVPYFLSVCIYFFLLIYWSSLYILHTCPLSVIFIAINYVFLNFVGGFSGCLITSLFHGSGSSIS